VRQRRPERRPDGVARLVEAATDDDLHIRPHLVDGQRLPGPVGRPDRLDDGAGYGCVDDDIDGPVDLGHRRTGEAHTLTVVGVVARARHDRLRPPFDIAPSDVEPEDLDQAVCANGAAKASMRSASPCWANAR
jgi:hypothetical protein